MMLRAEAARLREDKDVESDSNESFESEEDDYLDEIPK